MAEKKERIKIVEVIRSTSSTKVTFSNGLKISLGAGDLDIFNDYGFVNWEKGAIFELRTNGSKKEINPLGTNIYYKI